MVRHGDAWQVRKVILYKDHHPQKQMDPKNASAPLEGYAGPNHFQGAHEFAIDTQYNVGGNLSIVQKTGTHNMPQER